MTRTLSRRLAMLAVIALVLLPVGVLGANPSAPPDSSLAPTAGAPFPDLTMAPLVTLPPIVRPADRDPAIRSAGYTLGDPAAPVTIEVYEDFQCPYCRRFTEQVEPLLIEAYVRPGTARLVFRDLPFLGEESRWAAVAGRLAAEQDRFWPFHDYLFANQLGENVGSYTPDRLMAMAQAAGLDMDAFIDGLQVPAARALYAEIQAAAMTGAGALGINATPTVVVNGVRVDTPDPGAIAAAIAAAMAATTPSAAPEPSARPTPSPSAD